MVVKFSHASQLPGGLVKCRLLGTPSEFLIQLAWGELRICFCNKFPGHAETYGWGSTLGEPVGLQGCCSLLTALSNACPMNVAGRL